MRKPLNLGHYYSRRNTKEPKGTIYSCLPLTSDPDYCSVPSISSDKSRHEPSLILITEFHPLHAPVPFSHCRVADVSCSPLYHTPVFPDSTKSEVIACLGFTLTGRHDGFPLNGSSVLWIWLLTTQLCVCVYITTQPLPPT